MWMAYVELSSKGVKKKRINGTDNAGTASDCDLTQNIFMSVVAEEYSDSTVSFQ